MKNLAILVNTCDKFEDCWEPFFKLFEKFWPDYKGKIYLNTEYKEFSYGALDIVSLKVAEKNKDAHLITWSECLIRALDGIEEDVVLYLQEDYFLKDFVKNDIFESFTQLMNTQKSIDCIQLTDQSVIADGKSEFENLNKVKLNQRYRISCQAALWKKQILKSYLKPEESAWEFEEFGSKRAGIIADNFYVVDDTWVQLNKFEIIPYVFTGVIGGKWFNEVVPLFKENNIEIDYTIRGFHEDRKSKPFAKKIEYQVKKLPLKIKNEIYLLKLKNKKK